MNGSIIHRTIGGIAGTSNDPVMPSLRVAPATDQQHNTLRPRLVPLACWKVEDVRFEFDSSFPRPEIGQELPALGALIDQHTVDGVKPPVSLFGHADPVGDEEYNKKLSGRRAKAMYALLCRDVDKWEELYTQPLGGDNWQTLRAAT
jgi:outer membrane protein OmpA-like peptidoglycan-associated protein